MTTSPAATIYPDTIAESIAQAYAAVDKKQTDVAVRWFDLCRTQLRALTPTDQLQKKLASDCSAWRKEAEKYRALHLASHLFPAKTKIAVFGDSLGLPRPNETSDPECHNRTYSGIIRKRLEETGSFGQVSVDSHCERYFTTDSLVELLPERRKSVKDAHVLVHLGLNDCATRIFMTDQRLALDLLPKDLSKSILDFAKKYRHPLILAYPDYQYVVLPRFITNLHRIAAFCKEAGAKSLTFCTVIVVPVKFWHGTPHVCRNFTRYSLAVMEAAAELGAHVLDVDRLMWQAGTDASLNVDGMHLGPEGHKILADTYLKTVFKI